MDNESKIRDLLSVHGLRKTPIRKEMLDVFMNHDFALSASDLVHKMTVGNDRVTVYRALVSFEEHGILHKASEDKNGVKYALSDHNNPHEHHSDQHIHFICDGCHQTYCIEGVVEHQVKVSSDFQVDRVNFTLHGLCKQCLP
ncbi:MAG TPA: transcriptional repressor [Cytophagales bacterium]|nr:transcriptional repressor [Cytophagales bacterium]HAA17771.1 transcriptional repressor [Cytophagales bacterium]HAP59853.1 transcriptional repressor [Cytophagales bacterium]